jgi:hypothetical protein
LAHISLGYHSIGLTSRVDATGLLMKRQQNQDLGDEGSWMPWKIKM